MKKKLTLLPLVAVSLFALGACSSGSEPTKGEADASTVETTTVADKTSFAVGDTIVFDDMIHYTMVKTTFFNGVQHPSIGIWTRENQFKLVHKFTYEQFRDKL